VHHGALERKDACVVLIYKSDYLCLWRLADLQMGMHTKSRNRYGTGRRNPFVYRALAIVLPFMVFMVGPISQAQEREPGSREPRKTPRSEDYKDFDHNATRFPLVDAHERIACESCHERGIFTGLRTQCSFCHRLGGIAQSSKEIDHIPSSDNCEGCHNQKRWFLGVRVDHFEVFGIENCFLCHNGRRAEGQGGLHNRGLTTTNVCNACHRSTILWSRVSRVDHNEIPNGQVGGGQCFNCHNGGVAGGKNPGHIPSPNVCDICHLNTRSWAPAFVP
jgi:hypothetical protein